VTTSEPESTANAAPRARRQLGRVLTLLGILDLSVVVWVIGLAVSASRLGLSGIQLLALIVAGIAAILGIRIWLAIRLRRRSGDLF